MRFRVHHLPFAITLLATPLPWVVSYTGVGTLTWAPEALALITFACLAATLKFNPSFTRAQLAVLLVSALHLTIQAARGQGIGDSAPISVIAVSLVFLSYFRSSSEPSLLRSIVRQTSILYAIHVGFIVVEILLINTGRTGIFMTLSGGDYRPGLPERFGPTPQALFKQAQAASQLCLFSITWLLFRLFSRRTLEIAFGRAPAVMLVASLVVFILYPTTIVMIIGLLLLLLVTYVVPFTKRRGLRYAMPVALIVSSLVVGTQYVSLGRIYAQLVEKLGADMPSQTLRDATVYEVAVLNPLRTWLALGATDQLLGLGGIHSVEEAGVESGDVGLTITLLQAGLILGVIAVWGLATLGRRALVAARLTTARNQACFPWAWLACVNALIALGNLLSLVHYTVSLQTGGRTLFAFHIAVAMFSLQQTHRFRTVPQTVENRG